MPQVKRCSKKRRGSAKVATVMHEYKEGSLKSSSGKKVTDRDQAIAIAMSEAGLSKKKSSANRKLSRRRRSSS